MKKCLLLLSAMLCLSAGAQTTISSFENFPSMEDGTEFTFDSELVTLYQNGKYLFTRSIVAVTDTAGETSYYSYPGLVYGNAGQTYTNGDIIPGGWSATKTTYKGMPEAQYPSGLQETTGQIDNADVWAAPLNYSGYIKYMTDETYFDYFAGEYMTFGPVSLSGISGNNFTISETAFDWDTYDYVTYSMPGYNMFYRTVTLPTDTTMQYTVTGFYYIYNNAMQFVPIAFEEYIEPSDLYGAWYYGIDGEKYRITDELYVVQPTAAGEPEEQSSNYIYITDNLWEYNYYGWIIDWLPTYMAIDVQGDAELYDKIASMQTIEAGTLVATIASNYTNPRLIVTEAPVASDNTTELEFTQVNLNDTLKTNGHSIYGITAVYKVIDGVEYLMGWDENFDLWQPFKLDRRYMGDVQLEDGEQYYFDRVVVKQLTAWSSNDPISELNAPAAAQPFQVKKALNESKPSVRRAAPSKAPQRMNPKDPRYYDNMLLCPLNGDVIPTAISEVNTDNNKQVSAVEYVNIAGQTSNVPFDGLNIVITRYTDGSQQATKVMK